MSPRKRPPGARVNETLLNRSPADNHEVASTCAVPALARDSSGRTGFGSRGSTLPTQYRTIASCASRSTLTRGAQGHRGDADAAATAPERSSRLAVCRDRGCPWPVLRRWWHRLDDVHLQRDPGAGLVHHDPCHHRGRAGRRARAHWWPSSVLAAQPGTTATGGVIAVEPLAS